MFAGLIAAAIYEAQAERARWAALTPEQKAEEIKLRELRALEKIADAADRESKRTRFWG